MPIPVKILPRAQADVDKILTWMVDVRHSPQGARTWFKAYEAATKRISEMPGSFSFAPENVELERDIQHCLFKTSNGRTYRCIFVVEGNEALVLRVRGPGQLPLTQDEIE